jgi:hypothetical protein
MIYSKTAFFFILHMQILCSMEPIGTRAYAFAGKERSLNAARSMCEGEWGRARGKEKKNAGRHIHFRDVAPPLLRAPNHKLSCAHSHSTQWNPKEGSSWAHPNVGAVVCSLAGLKCGELSTG